MAPWMKKEQLVSTICKSSSCQTGIPTSTGLRGVGVQVPEGGLEEDRGGHKLELGIAA